MNEFYIADTVTLINIIENTTSNLAEIMFKSGIRLYFPHIVFQEFNSSRQSLYHKNKTKSLIKSGFLSFITREYEVDFDILERLDDLDPGELECILVALETPGAKVISDDKAAHTALEKFCPEVKKFWTSDILQLLVDSKSLSPEQANIIYKEMINNGFIGKSNLTFK